MGRDAALLRSVLWERDEGVAVALEAFTRNSLKVFHCPQEGHLPIHLVLSCPQLSQTYMILSLGIEESEEVKRKRVVLFGQVKSGLSVQRMPEELLTTICPK